MEEKVVSLPEANSVPCPCFDFDIGDDIFGKYKISQPVGIFA